MKDLKHVFEQEKSKGTSENEYFVSKVIVHPKYNDALFDIALMRTDRKVKLGRHVQPICLPLGPLFPDIRTDAKVFLPLHMHHMFRVNDRKKRWPAGGP